MKTSRRLGHGKPKRAGRTLKSLKSKPTSPTPRDHSRHQSRNIFDRDNKLSSLFSSQTESTPDPSTRRTNRLPYADEDEGFPNRGDSSPPLDIRKKRRSITPPSQFQDSLEYDLRRNSPPGDLSNDFFNVSKPKKAAKSKKSSKKSSSQTSQERLNNQLRSPLKGQNDPLNNRDVHRTQSQGARRMSYNSRGRRVSSMGNGFEGEPHQDVPVSEYHKHLDKSIPESDRMRQLLIWNLKAELDKEESDHRAKQDQMSPETQTVNSIAKTINDELIQSLKDYSLSIDWNEGSSQKLDSVLLPNPKNKTNLENIKKYTLELNALKSEKQEWEQAYQQLTSLIDTVATPQDTEAFVGTIESQNLQNELNPTFANVEQNYQDIHQNLTKVTTDVESLYFSVRQMSELAERIENRGKSDLENQISKLLAKSLPQPHEKLVESKDILQAICLRANTKK
ncbi:hypothetical protein KGF57_000599 [Candida theae]|uniref:Uncharacterized protein n=1 Tax=Candida theae TaxID=1198502 RepID=A0AAD5BIR3_9ASCO|nr:uncharacterized protein KGF57_000599 [Candida theae]KAI5966635.1 hypothetical protein KGF57_000599 [Candida theae]